MKYIGTPEQRRQCAQWQLEYRARHPERLREIQRRHYWSHQEQVLAYQKIWRDAHAEQLRAKRVERRVRLRAEAARAAEQQPG